MAGRAERDAGLRRITRYTRGLAAGGFAVSAALTGVIAKAAPGRSTARQAAQPAATSDTTAPDVPTTDSSLAPATDPSTTSQAARPGVRQTPTTSARASSTARRPVTTPTTAAVRQLAPPTTAPRRTTQRTVVVSGGS